MNSVFLALDALLTRYINLHQSERGSLPVVSFAQLGASDCIISREQDDAHWRPVERGDSNLFTDIEAALDCQFHEDIKYFYGSFWSNGLCVERDDINFNLIQVWNSDDEERLKQNILGHAFAKVKGRLPLSFFIGCSNGNDIICVENDSAQVVLEKPGRKAHKILAPSLETFLLSLQPTLDEYS